MKIEKVIFHTRFRDLAFNALEAILELKKAGLKEVVLTYVIPREEVAFVPYGGYLKDEAEQLEEVARLAQVVAKDAPVLAEHRRHEGVGVEGVEHVLVHPGQRAAHRHAQGIQRDWLASAWIYRFHCRAHGNLR